MHDKRFNRHWWGRWRYLDLLTIKKQPICAEKLFTYLLLYLHQNKKLKKKLHEQYKRPFSKN